MKTPLRHRLKARLNMRQRRTRARKAGWESRGFWVKQDWLDQMALLADRFGMSRRAIACAVFEVGLKRLTPTDAMHADRHFRDMAGLPICKLLKLGKLKMNQDPQTGRILGYSPKEGVA